MADTSKFKNIIEPWFRDEYLREKHPGAEIKQEKLSLIWGGHFEYDAVVYQSGKVESVYLLSCSEYKTSNGKGGAGKFHKIKSDILMMLGTQAPNKVMAFLGKTMYQQFKTQQDMGRLPQDINCLFVEPTTEISQLIHGIRGEAASEVTPNKQRG